LGFGICHLGTTHRRGGADGHAARYNHGAKASEAMPWLLGERQTQDEATIAWTRRTLPKNMTVRGPYWALAPK